MATKFEIDGEAIRQLADILVDTQLTEIEYENEGRRIRVSRGANQAAMVVPQVPVAQPTGAAPAPQAAADSQAMTLTNHPGTVKSPMVGTAYMCPEPGASPFVKVGDAVDVGQTLMIIEAMKVMNPIKATKAGKVTQVLAQDGKPVEFGEPLMVVE